MEEKQEKLPNRLFRIVFCREITLEVLSQEPEGAFMVRESTSKPGCYALSLRVPREFQPSGIAHYLIMRTNKGYKIKVSYIYRGQFHGVLIKFMELFLQC